MKALRPDSSSLVSRRQFLRNCSFAAGGMATLAFPFVSAKGAASVNDRLRIAIIGVGGRGGANLDGVKSESIVALCDVHEQPVLRAAERYPGAKKYSDFRRLYDNARDFFGLCDPPTAGARPPAALTEGRSSGSSSE